MSVDADVAVVTWNTAGVTPGALRRLLDAAPGVRVLVHDNASSDGTVEAIRREVPEADVVAGDANLGFAAGMNRLLARSDAPWVLALNPDAWPEPGAVEAMVEAGERTPRAAAVAPRVLRPDGTPEHSTHRFPSVRLAAAAAVGVGGRVGERLLLEGEWAQDRPSDVDWAVGAALLLRRAALDDVGGFDERYFMYAEDLEWCWRARRAGWTIRFEPSAVVRHVGNVSGDQAYGEGRADAVLASTYAFYGRTHGSASTAAFRALNAAGAARLWVLGLLRRDEGMARFWRRQIPLHLRSR